MCFQKVFIPPSPRKVIGNSKGDGVSTGKNYNRKPEAKLEILVGEGRVHTKKPSLGEVSIYFSGTTKSITIYLI